MQITRAKRKSDQFISDIPSLNTKVLFFDPKSQYPSMGIC